MNYSTVKKKTIDDLPDNILADGIFSKLLLADRLIQQRTCRRWKRLMPFNDEYLKVIPLIEEMLSLWHREAEQNLEEKWAEHESDAKPLRNRRKKIGLN